MVDQFAAAAEDAELADAPPVFVLVADEQVRTLSRTADTRPRPNWALRTGTLCEPEFGDEANSGLPLAPVAVKPSV